MENLFADNNMPILNADIAQCESDADCIELN